MGTIPEDSLKQGCVLGSLIWFDKASDSLNQLKKMWNGFQTTLSLFPYHFPLKMPLAKG